MEMLKQIFPYSFKEKKDVGTLIIHILLYVVIGYAAGFVLGLIPLVGGILGWVVSLYSTVGWVLALLDYLKVLK